MTTFEKNIKNAFGEPGAIWLRELPSIIEKIAEFWSLTNIEPVKKMSWNYVAYALQDTTTQLVLKISCDKQLIQDEYRVLKHFDGHGAVKVIDMNLENNAMLLERAIPGYLLKENHPANIEDTIQLYAQVVNEIASRRLLDVDFTHMSEWSNVIDEMRDERIRKDLIEKAKEIKSALLNSVKHEYLCHGDLHLENIIQRNSNWVAIDPKGIIGEMAFEVAAFDLISKDEMKDSSTIQAKIIHRITLLASAFDIPFERLLSWVFLRIMISAQWFIEDKGDPSQMLRLAHHVYPLLKK